MVDVLPPAVVTTCAGGQVIEGGCVSLTVTVNEQLAELPAASVAVTLIVVIPFGNVVPDAGELITLTMPEQLSVAEGLKVTTAEHILGAVETVMFEGHVGTGGVTSFTVTLALAVLFAATGSLVSELAVV